MTKFMLGGANLGNSYKGVKLNNCECFNLLDMAWQLGVTTIDTARSYGESEQIIADYIKHTGHKFHVYTKGRSQDDFLKSAEILGPNLFAKLWHYQAGDKIDCQIDGISCYDAEEEWDPYDNYQTSVIQVPWNIIDRRNEWVATAAKGYGIETICRSVFIRGSQ